MSRERPTKLPRVLPGNAARAVKNESANQRAAREELERLKNTRGPAFLAGFFNPMMRASMPRPNFIRAGYEAGILDDLRDFFTFRPWRPRTRRSGRTHKERRQMLRRLEQEGFLRRAGGGRYELTKVAPHA